MKIALDPYMFRHLPLPEVVRTAADIGYQYLELSPREDFTPFFVHPTADDDRVAELKRALAETGVRISSVLPLYRWSEPDEDERQAAVRYWKRAIELTAELGCPVMNSEFNGRPERAAASEAAFWRSMEELLPVFEREGIALNLEAHPDDFVALHRESAGQSGPGAPAPGHRAGRGRLGRVLRHAARTRLRRHRHRLRLRLGGTRGRVVGLHARPRHQGTHPLTTVVLKDREPGSAGVRTNHKPR